jgi:hypothetical protein
LTILSDPVPGAVTVIEFVGVILLAFGPPMSNDPIDNLQKIENVLSSTEACHLSDKCFISQECEATTTRVYLSPSIVFRFYVLVRYSLGHPLVRAQLIILRFGEVRRVYYEEHINTPIDSRLLPIIPSSHQIP